MNALIQSCVFRVKNFVLKANSKYCIFQDQYVVFPFVHIFSLAFDSEGVLESCQLYDFVNLESIRMQAIFIHK